MTVQTPKSCLALDDGTPISAFKGRVSLLSDTQDGLGMIMQDIGDEKRALEAFRKALAVNPHLEKVPDLVKMLSEKVEGRDI